MPDLKRAILASAERSNHSRMEISSALHAHRRTAEAAPNADRPPRHDELKALAVPADLDDHGLAGRASKGQLVQLSDVEDTRAVVREDLVARLQARALCRRAGEHAVDVDRRRAAHGG